MIYAIFFCNVAKPNAKQDNTVEVKSAMTAVLVVIVTKVKKATSFLLFFFIIIVTTNLFRAFLPCLNM